MSKQPQPPQPPPFERRIQIPTLQLVGIPLLLLLPVLALFGVFGHATTTESSGNDVLALEVTYPTRTRYNLAAEMIVEAGNQGTEPATLVIELDRAYIDQFTERNFLPDVESITPEFYRVELPDVPPGEARTLTITMRADGYWRHTGQVTASLDGDAPVSVALGTWVYP